MHDVADPMPEAHGDESAWRWKSSLLVAETLPVVLYENVSQETAGLPRLVRSPFPGQQGPREVGPDH